MSLVIVRHKVRDYSTWKPVFDESEDLRHEYGFGGGWVTRNQSDPSELVVVLECEDLARVREFMKSDRVREMMRRAGVIGEPDILYLNEVATVKTFATTGSNISGSKS